MITKNIKLVSLSLLFAAAILNSQEKILAEFNYDNINAEEFVKRFELTPRVRSSTNIDSQKIDFLLTLTAEKLWAEEARQRNLDTLESYEQYVANLEKMLVRDALFKREIESKVKISQSDFESAGEKSSYELKLKFLFSKSKEEIDSLHSALKTIPIDSLLKDRDELKEQQSAVTVVFGQMNESLEDSLFNLSVGEYTDPVFNQIGWVIYYLADRVNAVPSEPKDSQVQQVLSKRETQKIMRDFLSQLFKDLEVNTDVDLFNYLASALTKLLNNKEFKEDQQVFYLYEDDLIKMIKSLPPESAGKDFIKFESDPVTLKDFMYYLYFNNFKSPGLDNHSVQVSLKRSVDDFIHNEIIAREGFRRGLHLLPEIQDEIDMWKDNFLSQYLKNTFTDEAKISQTELDNYISELSDSTISTKFVAITEVKLAALDEAQYIFTQISLGRDFERILEEMRLPPERVIKSDSLTPINNYADLASIIDEMDSGEVYGPINRAAGYSILKLNEVEERQLSPAERNKIQVDQKKEILFYKKLENILTERTIDFAKKYELEVNTEKLSEINVTEIPTLIYRYYGFGGQTVAAPFLNLFYDWYYKYKTEKKESL